MTATTKTGKKIMSVNISTQPFRLNLPLFPAPERGSQKIGETHKLRTINGIDGLNKHDTRPKKYWWGSKSTCGATRILGKKNEKR